MNYVGEKYRAHMRNLMFI